MPTAGAYVLVLIAASLSCGTGISYRLAGWNITGEGRLEVQYNNTWGTVCDDSFSNVEANIACRSIGYSDGGEFINSLYGPGPDPIWLDDVKCNGNEQSIADCPHQPWSEHNCVHDEDVSIRCRTGSPVLYRLAGSNITGEGRLEVFYNYTWGTVCNDGFGNVEASVACGSLGHSVGGEFIGSLYGPGEGPIWLDDVVCNGTEQSIADCDHLPWGSSNCGHDDDASISCWTNAQIAYRLAGSSVTGEGRLEVYYNYTWGTVCDNGFGNVEAAVACGSLGYPIAGEFIGNPYGAGVGPIWLDDVICNGTEQNIADCAHLPWGEHDCGHSDDVSIRCWTNAQIVYRLAGSSVTGEGRLEVFYNYTWGTVCDDAFSKVEAIVVCGSLGYPVGGEFIGNLYGPGVGPIWLDDAKCKGTEQNIADCPHRPWGSTDCSHSEDASIRCWTNAQVVYRLTGSSVMGEGRLEVFYNYTWGTVCYDYFSNVEASVACRSLGNPAGGEFISSLYGAGVGPIWLDDVTCSGAEQSIADCAHRPWGEHNCVHSQDVSIRCFGNPMYRLVGGPRGEGRLEVYYSFTWGTVCDDDFDGIDATVACHSLGFPAGGYFIYNQYGSGEGPIWLDEVQCSGAEQSIADCAHLPWGQHNCQHYEDVSIGCYTSVQIVYQLAGSNVTGEGRLEVKYSDTWGTICDNSFSNIEARIACGSLGYSNGGEFISNLYGPGEGKIWLSDVKCNGTERSIADCSHLPWGSHNCAHDEDVSIRCH